MNLTKTKIKIKRVNSTRGESKTIVEISILSHSITNHRSLPILVNIRDLKIGMKVEFKIKFKTTLRSGDL